MIRGATLVTVVRHGQVDGRPFVYRGGLDEAMTQHGLQQVRRVVVAQAAPAYDRIATSPLRRCLQFASAYAAETGVALQVMASMREMEFGAWEGLTPEQVAQRDPESHALFRASAHAIAPPGGETLAQLQARVAAGWDDWLRDSAGGHRLLLTHAGVMRALLMHLIGLPPAQVWSIALPEAAHFRVSVLAGEAPILLNLNACAA